MYPLISAQQSQWLAIPIVQLHIAKSAARPPKTSGTAGSAVKVCCKALTYFEDVAAKGAKGALEKGESGSVKGRGSYKDEMM